jgi:hypothetical protein
MFLKKVSVKKIFSFFLLSILAFSFLTAPLQAVKAANLQDAFKIGDGGNDDPLDSAAEKAGYDTGQTSPDPIIQTIIQVALSFLGIIFLILTIYGGFLWMTAAGNEEKIGTAKKILTGAIIGLIIVVAAYAISTLVIGRLGGAVLK